MKRSIVAAVTTVALLMLVTFQTVGAQQTFHAQDFASAVGTIPPPGYSIRHGSSNQAGGWRFDNPQGWALTGNLMSPVAIVDSDFAGSTGVRGRDEMYLPYFDASTAVNAIQLNFDHDAYVYLTQYMFIDVFDGMTWNNVHTDLNVGTAAGAEAKTIDITTACGGSSTCRIRFKMTHDWDFYWMVDNILVEELGSVDMAMVSVDSPSGSPTACTALTTLPVTCTFKNNGTANVPAGSVVLMQYDRDSGAQIENDTALILMTGGMNFGDEFQFTFANQANVSGLGAHTFDVSLSFAGDGNLANDIITGHMFTTNAPAAISSLPVSENFDSATGTTAPAGWTQDANDSFGNDPDWYFGSSTPSTAGPDYNGLGDHTSGTGGFAFVEDSFDDCPVINLLSPCVDLTTATAPKLSFWIHNHDPVTVPLNPLYFNPLSVDIVAGGIVTPDVAVSSTDTGDVWTQIIVDLTPYVGQVIQVQFRGSNANIYFTYDTSIDDVLIFEPGITFGQPPQPGIAVMDLNNAVDGNGTDVANSTVGPFSTTTSVGSPMTYTFSGEANQAIILVGGPLNPLVASYPGFGQFDIGNLPLSSAGIPINLTLWADGSDPTMPSLNNLFNTGPLGTSTISFTTPNIPLGPFTTFQSLILNTVNIFGFSNAIELTIN